MCDLPDLPFPPKDMEKEENQNLENLEKKVESKEEDWKPVRDEKGRILPGQRSLNVKGRPPGKTLKEFAREYLMGLSDEDKMKYLAKLPQEIVWKMAEGNPHQTTENETEVILPQPLLEAIRPKESQEK